VFFIKEKDSYTYYKMRLKLSEIREEIFPLLKKKFERIEHLIKFREFDSRFDKEILMNIYNRAFLTSPDPFRPLTINELDDIDSTIFFIKLYGLDSGFISISIEESDQGEKIGLIPIMAVLPERQRRGLGSALALKAYDFLKNKDIEFVECEVGEDNLASFLFVKFIGFKVYGKEVIKFENE